MLFIKRNKWIIKKQKTLKFKNKQSVARNKIIKQKSKKEVIVIQRNWFIKLGFDKWTKNF